MGTHNYKDGVKKLGIFLLVAMLALLFLQQIPSVTNANEDIYFEYSELPHLVPKESEAGGGGGGGNNSGTNWLGNLLNWLGTALDATVSFFGWAGEQLGSLWSWINTTWNNFLTGLGNWWESVTTNVSNWWNGLSDPIQGLLKGIGIGILVAIGVVVVGLLLLKLGIVLIVVAAVAALVAAAIYGFMVGGENFNVLEAILVSVAAAAIVISAGYLVGFLGKAFAFLRSALPLLAGPLRGFLSVLNLAARSFFSRLALAGSQFLARFAAASRGLLAALNLARISLLRGLLSAGRGFMVHLRSAFQALMLRSWGSALAHLLNAFRVAGSRLFATFSQVLRNIWVGSGAGGLRAFFQTMWSAGGAFLHALRGAFSALSRGLNLAFTRFSSLYSASAAAKWAPFWQGLKSMAKTWMIWTSINLAFSVGYDMLMFGTFDPVGSFKTALIGGGIAGLLLPSGRLASMFLQARSFASVAGFGITVSSIAGLGNMLAQWWANGSTNVYDFYVGAGVGATLYTIGLRFSIPPAVDGAVSKPLEEFFKRIFNRERVVGTEVPSSTKE